MAPPIRKKVLHIADSHFDETSRFIECITLHNKIVELARAEKPNLIIHEGDVFERKSTPKERWAVAAFLIQIAEIAPVLIVRGNHDAIGDLPIFAKLHTKHPVIVEEGYGYHFLGGVEVHALAWPQRAYLAAGSDSQAETELGFRDSVLAVLRSISTHWNHHGAPRVFAGHCMVRGSATSTGQPLVGVPIALGTEELRLAKASCYVIGHIHKHQEWEETQTDGPVIYPGSPRRTAFGEIETKGVVITEFENGLLSDHRHVALPATPMHLIEADWKISEMRESADFIVTGPPVTEYKGAEIRFRYRVESDRREAAAVAAERWKEDALALGAVNVKLDPDVQTTTRARVPELAATKSIEDKIRLVWKAKNQIPSEEREIALIRKLHAVESGMGAAALRNIEAVRIDSMRAKGFGVFRGEIAVDFTSLPKLVAVCGKNGAGKSTFLDLAAPGALYRATPSRGLIARMAQGRDSFVETKITNGSSWTIKQMVDAHSGKGESVVTDENGDPAFVDTKVESYDTWAETHLQSEDVFYSSSYVAQASLGFLGLKKGDRKELILKAIGQDRIESMAEACRRHAALCGSNLMTLRARLRDESDRGYDITKICATIQDLEKGAKVLEKDLGEKKKELAFLVERHGAYDAAILGCDAIEKDRAALRADIDKCKLEVTELDKRIAKNKEVLADAAKIRAAEDEHSKILDDLEIDEAALAKADAAYREWETRARENINIASKNDSDSYVVESMIKRMDKELESKSIIENAVVQLPDAIADLRSAQKAMQDLDQESLDMARAAGTNRAQSLREGLFSIANDATTIKQAKVVAKKSIAADDEIVGLLDDTHRDAIRQRADAIREDIATKQTTVNTFERLAKNATVIKQVALDREAEATKLAELRAARAKLTAIETELKAEEQELLQPCRALRSAIGEKRARDSVIAPLLKLATALALAEDRIAEHSRNRASWISKQMGHELDLERLPIPIRPQRPESTTGLETVISVLDGHITSNTAAIAVENSRHGDAMKSAQRCQGFEAKIRFEEDSHADWIRLSEDLGKNGLQALEIDAAGPELTDLVNNLLHTCVGPRWTVAIETTRLGGSSGKKELEDFVVRVTDTQTGFDGPGELMSGGEKVMINEAIGGGLQIVSCRRHSSKGCTLIRDETGAALDAEKSVAYVAMLRMAADIVGASQVLFVSHSDQIQAMADARILIENGKVSIQ